ncbi:superoxide dismutase [Ni] [Bythopirellula polymerisocia]|uniref:Nickel-containing superoxide dismutase n=1 Tax=Bythopirellula polymerisocia TaxID=2528003 RepID=A0A5C6CUN3_9BACT|nr:superoxide dismutase [Ni] [Bythopirellula polymerisocia]TWU28128.1 Nickel-containing superoxide dismutase [Bythopirellula polymerisocia]
MKTFLSCALLVAVALVPQSRSFGHCEVPCGIFDDGARFAAMMEDSTTILKGINALQDLAGTPNPNNINQMGRWITTKEEHATKIQHTIAQYFMAQRIKPEAENYVEQLTKAHAVMVAAMKCKQAAEPATVETLNKAIGEFKAAYGKGP